MAQSPRTERTYVVSWGAPLEEDSEEVEARNAGEAVWLVHARNRHPEGTQYSVAPQDKSESPRNFTVGRSPRSFRV